MNISLIVILAALAALALGTELVVRGARGCAARLHVSPLVIGLTVVAFGTDLPELVVAIKGALLSRAGTETSSLIIGNALGSAVAQITLVAGLVALLTGFAVSRETVRQLSLPFVGSVVLLLALAADGAVQRWEGLCMVGCFIWFVFSLVTRERARTAPPGGTRPGPSQPRRAQDATVNAPPPATPTRAPAGPPNLAKSLLLLGVGLGMVVASADIALEAALVLIEAWGVTPGFVGAIVLALGTSAPELAVSLGAGLRGHPGLSLGNLFGSNVFDTLVPLGAAAVIYPLQFPGPAWRLDLMYLLAVTLGVMGLFWAIRNPRFGAGIMLLIAYLPYVSFQLLAP